MFDVSEENKSPMVSQSMDTSTQNSKLVPTLRNSICHRKQLHVKFLVYGRTRWIGGLRQTLQETRNITEYGRGQLEKCSQLVLDIQNVKLTRVFNAARVNGRLNVDWCETYKQQSIRTIVVGTLTLADVCREHGLLLMYHATGCIFEYAAEHPEGSGIGFKEEDNPNFMGFFYSKTKAMASLAPQSDYFK